MKIFLALLVFSSLGAVFAIQGGEPAPEQKFPFLVSIRMRDNNQGRHFCSGVILTPGWVLSAARCFPENVKPANLTVVAGTTLLNSTGESYDVREIKLNDNFNTTGFGNEDSALLRIKGSIHRSGSVQNAQLIAKPRLDQFELEQGSEQNYSFAGWGLTHYPESALSEELQQINLKKIKLEECRQRYNNIKNKVPIFSNQLCTYQEGGSACFGDLGGPLVYNGKVVGILTRDHSCATGKPDVFTLVQGSMAKFIKDNAGTGIESEGRRNHRRNNNNRRRRPTNRPPIPDEEPTIPDEIIPLEQQ